MRKNATKYARFQQAISSCNKWINKHQSCHELVDYCKNVCTKYLFKNVRWNNPQDHEQKDANCYAAIHYEKNLSKNVYSKQMNHSEIDISTHSYFYQKTIFYCFSENEKKIPLLRVIKSNGEVFECETTTAFHTHHQFHFFFFFFLSLSLSFWCLRLCAVIFKSLSTQLWKTLSDNKLQPSKF